MGSWFSWALWPAIVYLSWWVLGQMGVSFSVWEIAWSLFRWIPGLGTTPEDSNEAPPFGIKKLSDAVFLLHEPEGTPEIEVVFIHGLQLSGFRNAYWETWTTTDTNSEEIFWPQTLLKEEFPKARILSLSYDSSAITTDNTGREDVYAAGESLLVEMVQLQGIGQRCPVVFVCHSLGGLVIKQVVLQAYNCHRNEEKFGNFLGNIRGFFFYATPHDGSKLADLASALPVPFLRKSPMVAHLRALDNANGRLKSDFESIANGDFLNKWKFSVVAEKNATRMGNFYAQVVSETSARFGGGHPFLPLSRDHFQVCKPTSNTDSAFIALKEFIFDKIMSTRITTGEQARQERAGLL